MDRPFVIVSNRGPLSFALGDDGSLQTKRGGGGLVTTLGPAVAGTGALWVAGAISEADRRAAEEGHVEAEGFRLRMLALDEDAYRAAYDVISNATLWFLHHGLWDAPRRPRFDRRWREAWDAYRAINEAFAGEVASQAPDGAVVLVQDYHLTLVAPRLRESRPDLACVHFHHTPFAAADAFRALPDHAGRELLEGLAAHRACGFHSRRWAANFESACTDVLGEPTRTFVSPAAVDADDILRVAGSDAAAAAGADLEAAVGDRALIVRVDRIELSKNILRGFHAFDDLLRTHPEWRERVVFGAFVYPSREGLAEYVAYRHEVEGVIERINAEWATDGWTPILYDPQDDFPRSVAALRRADVLLVNPVRDGLNLVAKEGPIVNDRDGVLVLSRESGVWAELAEAAVGVNPFDVAATADALHEALSMPAAERGRRAALLRELATARTAGDWLRDQLSAAG
jgi:trehalose 6-phosphate synthase